MEKLEIDKRNKEIIFNIILPNKKKGINIIICLCYNILNIVIIIIVMGNIHMEYLNEENYLKHKE